MSRHSYSTRNGGAPCIPGAYRSFKVTKQAGLPAISKRLNKIKIPPALNDFKKELAYMIACNLNAKGLSLRSGKIAVSKTTLNFLKNTYNLNKREWKSDSTILEDFCIDREIYRRANPDDKIECINFQLKFNNARGAKFYGRDTSGEIKQKHIYGLDRLCFK